MWKRILSDTAIALVSGALGGVFSILLLAAFSDDIRDLSVQVRTFRPPVHVLRLYEPRQDETVTTLKPVAIYNVYGIRESDNFEGVLGSRNPDGTTEFDKSARFKGFARDGHLFFTFAPTHSERFGGGQFQSVHRLDRDIYYGLVLGQFCDDKSSIQRILIGVVTRVEQQDRADEAATTMATRELRPVYDVDFSRRDCKLSLATR